MEKQHAYSTDSAEPITYQIKVEGYLGPQWADWFEGLAITQNEAIETVLTGAVADQAALYGLLKKVRDLGLALISLNRIDPDAARASKCNSTVQFQQ